MKCFFLFFFVLSAGAADDCANGKFFPKLAQMNGKWELGDCIVELHVCEKRDLAAALPGYLTQGPEEKSHFWLGDVYVKDRMGKKLYIPLYSPESRFPNTRVSLKENSKSFTYMYQDKNYDPKSGLKEKYELTIFKGRPRIEMKMNNSKETRRHPIRSLFFPNLAINCEDKTKN